MLVGSMPVVGKLLKEDLQCHLNGSRTTYLVEGVERARPNEAARQALP